MIIYDAETQLYTVVEPTVEEIARLDAALTRLFPWMHAWLLPGGTAMSKVEYDQDSHTLWLARPNAILEQQLDIDYERVRGLLRWKLDSKTIWSKAVDVGRAVISGRLAEDDPIVLQRKASCFGPPTKCDALRVEADGAWCRACSCGMTKLANIDGTNSKLTFRTLKCPKMKAGFSNAQG